MVDDNLSTNTTLDKKVELIFHDLYKSSEEIYLETIKIYPSFQLINKEHAISVLMLGSIFQLFNIMAHDKFPVDFYKNFLVEIKKIGDSIIPNFHNRVDEFLKGVGPIKKDLENKYKAFSDDHLFSLQFAAGYLMFCNLFSRFPSMDSEGEVKQITYLATKTFERVIHYWPEKKNLYFSL